MSSSGNPLSRILSEAKPFAAAMTRHAASDDEAEAVDLTLQSVRSWGARHLDSAAIEKAGRIDPAIYSSAADLGLFGLTIPPEHGGAGFSLCAASRVIEEVAAFDRSVATAIGLHCGLGLRGLIAFGSEALKARYLPGLAAGEPVAAFAATESEAGSHIANVKTTATWDGGSKLKVSGSKIFVTNGGVAGLYTILARTPGLGGAKRGYSLLLLPRSLNGFSVGAEEHKLGLKGSSTTTLSFDDIELDLDHVIGEPAKGLDLLAGVLAWGRTLMSAGCLGSARDAYRKTAAYVLERQQFGKPIGSFGQVREKIARMRTRLFTLESLARLTTLAHALVDSDIVWESSITKVFASESAWSICDDAVQLHGGSGYIEETGIARVLRDARITRIFEGANEVLRFHVAAGGLGFGAELVSQAPLAGQVDDRLTGAARRFDEGCRRLGAALEGLRKRYGLRVPEHQVLLARAADASISLLALLAVVLRSHGELAAGASDERAQALLSLASYSESLLGRDIDEALNAATRDKEEELVETISEAEYEEVRSRT